MEETTLSIPHNRFSVSDAGKFANKTISPISYLFSLATVDQSTHYLSLESFFPKGSFRLGPKMKHHNHIMQQQSYDILASAQIYKVLYKRKVKPDLSKQSMSSIWCDMFIICRNSQLNRWMTWEYDKVSYESK